MKSLGFWVGLAVVGIISLGAYLTVTYWDWLLGGADYYNNASIVRNIVLVVGSIVAILIALWRSLVAERQAKTAKRQQEIGERASLNERYRQAASMLGDSELTVRMAGIYALERLAEDYPSEFQHETFKLLLEFVRTPPSLKHPQPLVWDGWLQLERPATRQDVQAAITAILKLKQLSLDNNGTEARYWLDLQGAQLSGVELTGTKLGDAYLVNADLMFARLDRADLTGAHLQWADCRQASFEQADLSNAELSDADFSGAQAHKCKFRGATMPAKMLDTILEEADMTNARFPNTDLTGAKLRDSNLTGAMLRGMVYWIDLGGRHEADHNAVRITQPQLDEAVADPKQPPELSIHPVGDTEPRERLVWRGKAPKSDDT